MEALARTVALALEKGVVDLEGALRLWRRFAAHADDGVEEVGA